MGNEYWKVRINYGGGDIDEVFRTFKEADEFYNKHNYCYGPRPFTAETYEDIRWAERKIESREAAERLPD